MNFLVTIRPSVPFSSCSRYLPSFAPLPPPQQKPRSVVVTAPQNGGGEGEEGERMAKGEERHGAWSIGCFVTLETTLESDPLVQGQVFCYDDRTKVLVLLEGNKNSFSLGEKEGYDLRMLSVNFVKRVVTAEHLQDNSKKQMNKPLPYVCTKRTEQR
mmetsp:Transcript_12858/g.36006  ORF Transcript_12858/g.36006 Transcript_12858/m.36006 type:complete len:157 (+) Transcript_12858:116-586(+)